MSSIKGGQTRGRLTGKAAAARRNRRQQARFAVLFLPAFSSGCKKNIPKIE
jgi:hypothetical protein